MLMKGGGAGRPHAQRPYPGRPGRVPMGAAGVAAEAAPRPGADAAPRTGQRVLKQAAPLASAPCRAASVRNVRMAAFSIGDHRVPLPE